MGHLLSGNNNDEHLQWHKVGREQIYTHDDSLRDWKRMSAGPNRNRRELITYYWVAGPVAE